MKQLSMRRCAMSGKSPSQADWAWLNIKFPPLLNAMLIVISFDSAAVQQMPRSPGTGTAISYRACVENVVVFSASPVGCTSASA